MIWVLNENLRKIKILHKYKMAQFVNKSKEVGTFSITAVFSDENMYLLDKNETYYVLYNQNNVEYPLMGKIEKVEKEDEEDADYADTIKIEGRLINFLLTKRVINGTINLEGNVVDSVKQLIEDCYNGEDESERYININVVIEKDLSIYQEINITKQITGGTLFEAIQELIEQDKLCLVMYPVVEEKHDLSTVYSGMVGETNISKFKVLLTTGKDKRKGNTSGEKPIILSKSLSNVRRTSYSFDKQSYTNFAYIVGEGEGTERKWYGIDKGDNETAWKREELWVDARDIQSKKDDDTTLTDEEYEKLIHQRASEKFNENYITEEYESTLNTNDKRYVYGVDYNLGDWITIIDRDLDIEMDAQVESVTTTVQNNNEIIDIELNYGSVKKQVSSNFSESDAKVEKLQNEINYLKSIKSVGGNVGLSVKKYKGTATPLLSGVSTFLVALDNVKVNQVIGVFADNNNYLTVPDLSTGSTALVTGIMYKWENGSLTRDTSDFSVGVTILYV